MTIRILLKWLLTAYLCFVYANLTAAPWIDPGDELTRHHLQVLADAGWIKVPITTWPVMWSGIKNDLDRIQVESLPNNELWSYRYLRHEFTWHSRKGSFSTRSYVSNSAPGLTDFSTDNREEKELSVEVDALSDHYAVRLQGTIVENPTDNRQYRADGSFAAVVWGNWALGFGAIDRWWGPGWQNSLILSHNARPTPGFFIQRVHAEAFKWPILKYLGPWDFNIFANRLESNRFVKKANLLGSRVSIKPFSWFELGISRTAQWGGEGRPQDASSLWNLIIGNDSRGQDGIAADGSDEPGNQMGGHDFRINFGLWGMQFIAFQQRISEDEDDFKPIQTIDTQGLEISFASNSIQNRFIFEYSDTATPALKSDNKSNVIYEHPIYRSGYRYRGRPIGGSTDNDSRTASFMAYHFFSNGHQLSWQVGKADINRDGTNTTAVSGGNVFGSDKIEQKFAKLSYKLPFNERTKIEIGGFIYDEKMRLRNSTYDGQASPNSTEIESGVFLALEYRL